METEQEKLTTFFRFEDLRIYHKALEYINWAYGVSTNAGNHLFAKYFFEKFISSASGIALNIAEGSSRNKSQFVYYLKMAKSSVRECVVLTTIGQAHHFLPKDKFEESKIQLMEMTKMIGALIGSLQRSVKPGETADEEEEEAA
ncbi:MAG TPA: four helix bundle protein [Bacteroidales bacterium]|nr:four helix bundle protein [Bacteroidales bacterium]